MILKTRRREEQLNETNFVHSTRELIADCCETNATATIFSTSISAVTNATFLNIEGHEVLLRIHDDVPIRPLSLCCVTFNCKTRGHVFMSNVSKEFNDDDGKKIAMEIPDIVSFTELRSLFRVPVVETGQLSCCMKYDGDEYQVKAGDINMNGICIKQYEGALPRVGEKITIEMKLQEIELEIGGEVRNVTDDRIGVLFEETEDEKVLAKLVRNLESEYLRHQKKNKLVD